ncbi:hypothetical protein AU467_24165 [Mesorhizobium loti]|uniref:Uncharacterized protein n=1 Tax=Rhizobium loti TaxID=381 RepID=A0A101KS12_RHILI|nr:hypothetical protein AU467_24165 [Mesorhizobium loti]
MIFGAPPAFEEVMASIEAIERHLNAAQTALMGFRLASLASPKMRQARSKEIVSPSFQTGSNGPRIERQRDFHKFFLPYTPPFFTRERPNHRIRGLVPFTYGS